MRYLTLGRALVAVCIWSAPAYSGSSPWRAPGIIWAAKPRPAMDQRPAAASPYTAPLHSEPAAYRVLVQGDAIVAAGRISFVGGRLLGVHDELIHAELTREQLALLTRDPEIKGIQLSRRLKPLLDRSRPLVHADAVENGEVGGLPYTGRGVIVGIVDTGVDIRHPDFRNPDGSTRLLYLWDQTYEYTDGSGKPKEFTYGTECTAEQINAQLAGADDACVTDDAKPIDNIDTFGHGGHVAGIAVSSHETFRGMAPDAAIIAVRAHFEEGRILDGVDYVLSKAAALGRPCVINLSLGTTEGAHDGTSVIEQTLAKKTGPGRILVAAAGNEASVPGAFGHARIDFTGSGSTLHGPIISPDSGQVNNDQYSLTLDVWSNDTVNRPVYIAAMQFSSGTLAIQNPPDYRTPPENGDVLQFKIEGSGRTWAWVHMATEVNPANGRRETLILIDRCANNPCAFGGSLDPAITNFDNTLWSLHYQDTGSPGRLDLWPVVSSAFFHEAVNAAVSQWPGSVPGTYTFSGGDNDLTVTIPATSPQIIAVGSMVTRTSWTDVRGRRQTSTNTPPEGQISRFSSLGPTSDNRIKPDVVAPGEWIVSAHSTTDRKVPQVQLVDDTHMVLPGTSMAAPHVTGVIALMLQHNGRLSPADLVGAQGLLTRNTQTVAATGPLPNNTWGYGVLDAAKIFADPDFRPLPDFDTTPPQITKVRVMPSTNQLTVSWTTNEAATSLASATGPGRHGRATQASYVHSHRLVIRNLSDATEYKVRIESVDLAGNRAVRTVAATTQGGVGCGCRQTAGSPAWAWWAVATLAALRFRANKRTSAQNTVVNNRTTQS